MLGASVLLKTALIELSLSLSLLFLLLLASRFIALARVFDAKSTDLAKIEKKRPHRFREAPALEGHERNVRPSIESWTK